MTNKKLDIIHKCDTFLQIVYWVRRSLGFNSHLSIMRCRIHSQVALLPCKLKLPRTQNVDDKDVMKTELDDTKVTYIVHGMEQKVINNVFVFSYIVCQRCSRRSSTVEREIKISSCPGRNIAKADNYNSRINVILIF